MPSPLSSNYMADNLELIITSDGSHSVLNTALDETYHSRHGAIQESQHVFIRHGLEFILQRNTAKDISIFEVGFGTGLNALLTVQFALGNPVNIRYCSLEAFPLEQSIWSKLNYGDSLGAAHIFAALHQAPWSGLHTILPNFKLQKLHTTLEEVELKHDSFELVYYDAFAPSKQPEMWEMPLLKKIVSTIAKHGVFVTYCAKGQLKRDLAALGLEVETLPGPPGKKEMVRAIKYR